MSRLLCGGCGFTVPAGPVVERCPNARHGDGADHVLVPVLDTGAAHWPEPAALGPATNPFVHYRGLLHTYWGWRERGGTDAAWTALVDELDARVAEVDGRGFRVTPVVELPGGLVAKLETANVAGTHKGRHLFGTLLALEAAARLGGRPDERELAIASCGSAALAAATLARAGGRRLSVFVPEWAPRAVLSRLDERGARTVICRRASGEAGDPCVRRFRSAVAEGAVPFSCQGSDNALALDGGRTLGWELADQRADLAGVVIQVGGGALASCVARALGEAAELGRLPTRPRLWPVQAEGAAPLARAWRLLVARADGDGWGPALRAAATERASFMWPWSGEPTSVASGILDDETYDWLAIVQATAATGGQVVTVDEASLIAAAAEATAAVGGDGPSGAVGPTGAAGLAGYHRLVATGAIVPGRPTGVIFTGAT